MTVQAAARAAFPAARPSSSPARGTASRRWTVDVALLLAAVGLGASIALPVRRESWSQLTARGGVATFAGDVTAMAGTYLLLVMVVLAARLPALERAAGQDRLLRWHRRLSSAPLLLLGAHAVLTTLGFAQAARVGLLSETGSLIMTMAWIFAAVVSYVMLVAIAGASIRAARRRLSYETWWVIHLYTYLSLAFSVPHLVFDGTDFAGHPLARVVGIAFWLATAGVVVIYRVGLPIVRSVRHRLTVVSVRPEGPDTFSVVLKGRRLERLAVAGGQWFGWRFLTRDLWWHAHPFSLSAMPHPPYLRVTIKVSGDASTKSRRCGGEHRWRSKARTAHSRNTGGTGTGSLIGAGVGITPVRALLEHLPPTADVVVVQRASTADALVHGAELEELVAARRGRLVQLVGSRREHRLEVPARLAELIPDVAQRDVYLCGPDDFTAGVERAARALGVDAAAIHHESFEI